MTNFTPEARAAQEPTDDTPCLVCGRRTLMRGRVHATCAVDSYPALLDQLEAETARANKWRDVANGQEAEYGELYVKHLQTEHHLAAAIARAEQAEGLLDELIIPDAGEVADSMDDVTCFYCHAWISYDEPHEATCTIVRARALRAAALAKDGE